MKIKTVLLAATLAGLLAAQTQPREQVGPTPDGSFLLNSGWKIKPAGQQVAVDTLPMRSALSKDGKFLLVLNAGYNPPSISVIDVASAKEINRVKLLDGWLGLTIAPDGNHVYVGMAGQAKVQELTLGSDGAIAPARQFDAVPNVASKGRSFIGDVAVSPDGRFLYAADLYLNSIAVINLQSGRLIEKWRSGRRPYRILVHPDSKSYFVTSWADAALYHYDANNGALLGTLRLGAHPTDLVWSNKPAPAEEGNETPYAARIFVAAANTNTVYSVGITGDKQLRLTDTMNVSLTPRYPLGMTPSALALSKDQTRLAIVCSDANAVAIADVSGPRGHVLGFVPTGWYPTDVRLTDDNRLIVLNGKGGSVSIVPPHNEQEFQEYNETALRNSPYQENYLNGAGNSQSRFFAPQQGKLPPIQHVIYIVKTGRTYDQVLGDVEKGNGDRSRTVLGEKVTPNHHKLAREFVLFDNFYVNGDTSAEGQNWVSAAIAPDYTVKLSPNGEARRRDQYDFEGGEPANLPPTGYLWTNVLSAGLSFRNYGFWVENAPLSPSQNGAAQVARLRDPSLAQVTNMQFRGVDLAYADVDRAKEFLREWKEFEQNGQAPQLSLVRLGNDRTDGAAGEKSPSSLSLAAGNDLSIGMLVEGISKSKFWSSTAIFIVEASTENGADHVDSHRAPAFVISPYTRRGVVDSAMYNQSSVLRTIEIILGLRPLTHFDAAARPMFGSFSTDANAAPYSAEQPQVSLTNRNP